jgi:hypothetical protein
MTVSVDIVVPVLNEEVALPICIQKLYAFVGQYPERDWRIVVAETDLQMRRLRLQLNSLWNIRLCRFRDSINVVVAEP